jgi:DNA-binding NarL/FixJ family response regulator
MKRTQTTLVIPDRIRPPLRTLVVDDSAFLLEQLCLFLEKQPLIQVVGTALRGNDVLHHAKVLRPDLVLMDLNMPLVDGLQATTVLSSHLPNVRVIIMSLDDSPKAQASARTHGAHGFVGKPRILSDLMTEIRRVFQMNPTENERSTQ